MNKTSVGVLGLLFVVLFSARLPAEEKGPPKGAEGGMPPAVVVVSEVAKGSVQPEAEFVGTVFYREVSDIASEVKGKVLEVGFEEGRTVKEGDMLVRLDSELLERTLEATRASHEQVLSELELSKLEFARVENLFKEESIAEQVYDEHRYRVKGLEKKAESFGAELKRLEAEIGRKTVYSPIEGIVIKRHLDRGEWLSEGSKVATIAGGGGFDVYVDVPGAVAHRLGRGMPVKVKAGGREINGEVFSVIPRGEVSTRTFPVKIRLKEGARLFEAMEARVSLPAEERKKALLVQRDAVINVFGMDVVFAVVDSKAVMLPVKVVGYEGMKAGVLSEGLSEGMQVVVKGNERLRDGQPVVPAQKGGK